ncbi:CPBP family intramembrane glutamic endopeptidase [Mannheimia varigena]|uniref:CPBP family intramembrane glutamic endopeptidase n=1 Tax=Mannheimia varigena TaxID=85404 RepID=UPI0015B5766F|nr:CPBP family intramembrane glutamic endopeptidase [Mannheimia varigena]QLD33615.1 CPBP family intramembrane metalloprotease [Mannheimia varigena]
MPEIKIKHLTFADIIVLALIFFGSAIYDSSIGYIELLQNNQVEPEHLSINDLARWEVTAMQALLLLIAWLYLHWRKFDFGVLNIKVNRYTLPLTLLLVVGAGLLADFYQILHTFMIPEHYPETEQTAYPGIQYTPELIVTSLFNGFFEEIFFMGLVFAVKPQTLPKTIILSLFIRFAFHTYQGLAGALTITTLGISFWLFRRKIPMLVPFFLAHAIFDIFGLSFWGLLA